MDITSLNLTEDDFINREIGTWGLDYIESLLEKGYEPKLTSKGWTWILPSLTIRPRQYA